MNYFSGQPSHASSLALSPESGTRASTAPHEPSLSSNPAHSEAEHINQDHVERLKSKSDELDQWIRQILQDKNLRRCLALPDSLKSIALLSVDYGKSGASASLPSASLAHSRGALNQLVEFLKVVDMKYRNSEKMVEMEYEFSPFRERVEKQPIHRFEDREVEQFESDCEDWQLIHLGAAASSKIYGNAEKIYAKAEENYEAEKSSESDDLKGNPKEDIKGHAVYNMKIHGRHILVVVVKGTDGWLDWLVNLDAAPSVETRLGSAPWHKGLLTVALSMEEKIAKAIEDATGGSDSLRCQDVSILFTGHSAGGGVAQLFYAMANIPDRKMFKACKEFGNVHCITFGTPPISTECIPHGGRGRFLSVVNEGDPVILVQKEYAISLVDVYLLSTDELNRRHPEGFKIPDLQFKVSGDCLLLRYVPSNDIAPDRLEAWSVKPENLEKKLFGNVLLHGKDEYLKRVQKLALQKCQTPHHVCGVISWESGQLVCQEFS